jgi:hypothetical protein
MSCLCRARLHRGLSSSSPIVEARAFPPPPMHGREVAHGRDRARGRHAAGTWGGVHLRPSYLEGVCCDVLPLSKDDQS